MSPVPPLRFRPACSSTRDSVTASQSRGGGCDGEASSFPRPPSPPSNPPSLCFGTSYAPPVAGWVAAAPLQPRRPRSACRIHRDERVLLEAQLVPPPGSARTGNGGCDDFVPNQHAFNEGEPLRCRKLGSLKTESVGDVRLSVLAEHCEPTRLALVNAISNLASDCKTRQPDDTRRIGNDLLCLSAALQCPPRSRAPTPRVGPSRGPTSQASINDGSGGGCPLDVQSPLPSTEVTQRSPRTATRGAFVERPRNLGSTVTGSRRPLKPSPPASAGGRVVGPGDRPSRAARNARRIAHTSGLGCDMPKRASPVRRTGTDAATSDVSTVTSLKTVGSTDNIKSSGTSKGGEGVSGSVAVVGSVGTGGEVVASPVSQLAHVSAGSRQTLWRLAVQVKIPLDVLKVAWRIFTKFAHPPKQGKGCESKSREGGVGGAADWSSVRPKVASDVLEDGSLDAKSFAEVIRELVRPENADALPEAMLHNFFQTADTNGSGSLDFMEFAIWYSRYGFCEDMLLTEKQKMLRSIARAHDMSIGEVERFKRAFDTYDIDGSGVIEMAEFGQLMTLLLKIPIHLELPRSRIRQFWTEADSDNSGAVEFEEFLVFYRKYFDMDPVDGLEHFYRMRTLRPQQ